MAPSDAALIPTSYTNQPPPGARALRFPHIIIIKIHQIVQFTRKLSRHIGLLEADEDKIRKIWPKGTQVRMLYVPREPIRP